MIVNGRLGVGVRPDSDGYRLQLPNVAGAGGQGKQAVATSWATYSSIRFKEAVEPLPHPLETALRLRGVTFQWKEGGAKDVGLIAEEVQKVLSEAVSTDADGIPEAVAYDRVIPVLVEAIKEQQAQIEKLKLEVERLKHRSVEKTSVP